MNCQKHQRIIYQYQIKLFHDSWPWKRLTSIISNCYVRLYSTQILWVLHRDSILSNWWMLQGGIHTLRLIIQGLINFQLLSYHKRNLSENNTGGSRSLGGGLVVSRSWFSLEGLSKFQQSSDGGWMPIFHQILIIKN